jgi:electron transfer flavoprotein beta subunit
MASPLLFEAKSIIGRSKNMHIVVLAKVVPDYEVPSADFELVEDRAHPRYTRMIGLYDENAVELGVQLKEILSADLTILSYGPSDDVQFLRKALAMGADKIVLVEGTSDDPYVIAANLKEAIDKQGDVDLVLAGRQSSDMDRGVVPGLLAGMLDYAFVPQACTVENLEGGWKVIQITETGKRVLKLSGKGVLSITSIPENVPRIPAVKAIFAAKKKPVEKLPEIGTKKMNILEVSVKIPKMESVCELIPAEDVEEAARVLLRRLKEERYL